MKKLFIVLISLLLTSCISFYKKGYDVRKGADNISVNINQQKKKLDDGYKQSVRFYRLLKKSGLKKSDKPMPALLKHTLEMRKQAVEAKALMKKMAIKARRMKKLADGKKKIPETDPAYKEIDEITEALKEDIKKLEVIAKRYNSANEAFSVTARENNLFLAKAEDLRVKAEALEVQMNTELERARQDIAKAKKRAKTPGQRRTLNEMAGIVEEARVKGEEMQVLIDKLLEKLGDEEVAVGPHSDPNVTLGAIQKKFKEVQDLSDEYKELGESF